MHPREKHVVPLVIPLDNLEKLGMIIGVVLTSFIEDLSFSANSVAHIYTGL